MTRKRDSGDPKPSSARTVDAVPTGSQLRAASSRPPPNDIGLTLVALVGHLARCEHPRESLSPAVVMETDGSRVPICWCGTCGAMRLPDADGSEWIRTGLAQVLGRGGHLALLEKNVTSIAYKVSELSAAVRSLDLRQQDEGLSSRVDEIQRGLVELERAVNATLVEIQR